MEKIRNILILFFSVAVFLFPSISDAASLGIYPSNVNRTAGSIFTVSVYVSSPNEEMNAVSGVVSFSPALLEVVSLSKANSIISMWVVEPGFSNAQGTINFEGIVLNSGFSGNQGTILNITFRAKTQGTAHLNFSSTSVLANDGTGRNILNSFENSDFSILENVALVLPEQEPEAVAIISGVPIITSTTHPDQEKWYSNNTVRVSWKNPRNALEVRTLLSKSEDSNPIVVHPPTVSEREITPSSDGTWYFLLQIKTDSGWSAVGKYRLNIDTAPPNPFGIEFPNGNVGWEPNPLISFKTEDEISGIDRYDIKIGDDSPDTISPEEAGETYHLAPHYPGKYTLTVTAIDNAGNTRTSRAEFEIEAIDAPTITYYDESLELGDELKVEGTTYPDSDVTVYIKDKNGIVLEDHSRSNADGQWSMIISDKKLEVGTYTLVARVKDGRGAQSNETAPLTTIITSRLTTEIKNMIWNLLTIAILSIVSIAVIALVIFYTWRHTSKIIRRLRSEGREAEGIVDESFGNLAVDIKAHLESLKSDRDSQLNRVEEIKFLEKFEKSLSEAKKSIAKEVRDISDIRQ